MTAFVAFAQQKRSWSRVLNQAFNLKSTTGGGVTGSFLIMDAAKP